MLTNRQQEVLNVLAANDYVAASAARVLGVSRALVRQTANRARVKLAMAGKKEPPRRSDRSHADKSSEAARKKPPITLPAVPSLDRPLPKDPPS